MKKRITRRGFMGVMGATSVGLAASTSLAKTPRRLPGWSGTRRVTKIATICEMCFWRCGIVASVADGQVLRVEGNPEHPLNRGRLCARGNAGVDLLNDPDRLKFPLIRTGKRGEGQFRRATWDEALDFLADKLKALKQAHGAESVALFPHGIGARFFSTLMKAYGTPNSAEPSFAQCRGPRDVGYALTFGRGLGSPEPVDLEEARMVVLIGSHLGENVFTSQITAFADGLAKGAQLIVVDPRFSTAAGKADWWLPIRPGTDIALLLAWMHVLIAEGLCDLDYLKQHADGFEQLSAHVRPFTPEWAAAITDLPAERIRETARAMGKAVPAVAIHPGRHVTWYGDDTQRARAMAILTALLGSWGRKGGIFLPTPLPRGSFEMPEFPEAVKGRADGVGTRFPLGSEDLGITNGLVDATLSAQPYPIKAWIVYGQNVLQSIPQPERTLKAIEQLDLLVVVDVLPVDQIRYADLVLPEATYLERYDAPTVVESAKTPFVAVRFPVCEPKYESRPGWWIAKELARRLGLEAFFPWNTPEEHLATTVEPLEVNLLELRSRGAVAFPGRPYLEDRIAAGEPAFETGNGRIQLFSKRLQELGADPMPTYTPVAQPPKGFFRLIYGRAPVHSFARSQNNATLNGLMPENEAWVNAPAGLACGLSDGQRIILENEDGVRSQSIRVRLTEGIRPDCIYMVHGFGQRSKQLRHAFGRGASDTDLMTRVKVDPLMGGTGMRVTFVRPLAQG
jgi:thiosulfate reductase/polysulfide reductase chain A